MTSSSSKILVINYGFPLQKDTKVAKEIVPRQCLGKIFLKCLKRYTLFDISTQKPKRSSNTTMPAYLLLPMSIMTILLLLCCRASSSQVVRWLKVSRRVMSYTSSAPAAPRQYDRVMLRKASWPAVSQICSLICFPSIVIMRAPNSTPGGTQDLRDSDFFKVQLGAAIFARHNAVPKQNVLPLHTSKSVLNIFFF